MLSMSLLPWPGPGAPLPGVQIYEPKTWIGKSEETWNLPKYQVLVQETDQDIIGIVKFQDECSTIPEELEVFFSGFWIGGTSSAK